MAGVRVVFAAVMRRQTSFLAIEAAGAGPPGSTGPADPWLDPAHHLRVAAAAARTGADLLLFPDSFGAPDDPSAPALDAVAVAARVAPVVPRIGLAPTVTVTHTEPFHVSKAIATLDRVSGGWAGWQPAVSRTAREAALFGRKPAAAAPELWREAAEAIEVVVRLWDSWEDDAVIRDAATGRYVDRDKLHYIDFVGEFFSVKGPAITPRSPQGHPLIVLRGDEPEALPVAAAWADVVRVATTDARDQVRAAVAAAGRDPDAVAVLLDIRADRAPEVLVDAVCAAVRDASMDGVTLIPGPGAAALDVVADEVVPRLLAAGLREPDPAGPTLRDRFGLPRADNYFASGDFTAGVVS
jgi:alkanesulfonate monooxygenase SsuD/methylene tetrahydromethanopterin reductase-like flavin-dependent oxidoreductase (luciferase family)